MEQPSDQHDANAAAATQMDASASAGDASHSSSPDTSAAADTTAADSSMSAASQPTLLTSDGNNGNHSEPTQSASVPSSAVHTAPVSHPLMLSPFTSPQPPSFFSSSSPAAGADSSISISHLTVDTSSKAQFNGAPSHSLHASPTRTPSPSHSISPPHAPPPLFLQSFRGVKRLVDYFLVLGRVNDSEVPLVPMRKLSRSNSQTIQPISDVMVVMSDKLKDVTADFTRVQDFSNKDIDVNPGLLSKPCFIAESRMPRRRGSAVIMPITGIDVIYVHDKETPKEGYTQLQGNLNARSLRSNVALCVERDAHKSPLIDIKVVCVPGGVKAIEEAKKYYATHPNASAASHSSSSSSSPAASTTSASNIYHPMVIPSHITNPFTALIPNEYIRVDKSINPSKDYFLVYKIAKRRAVEYMSYEPFLVDRYPEQDWKDFALETQGVSMLCFPRGMLLKPDMPLPDFQTFVLTQANGAEVYGAALTFYEIMPQDPAAMDASDDSSDTNNHSHPTNKTDGEDSADKSKDAHHNEHSDSSHPNLLHSEHKGVQSKKLQVAYCPRCLCLLSHYPFYELFKTFLNQLYRIAVSPSNMPLERFIGHFFHAVPVPRLYVPNINYSIGHAKVALSLPPSVGLPYKNFSLLTLFRCLSVDNVVAIFEHVLSEGKVVFYSNSHATLTPVAEALRCLLFPMKWQCVFIPILPTNLAYTVRAPVPFIIGLHRSFLDELKVPDDVFLVDLDRNRVRLPNNIIRPPDLSSSGSSMHDLAAGLGLSSNPGGQNSANHDSHHLGQDHASHSHTSHNDETKLIHPLPMYMKDYLLVELLDLTTSPLDGKTTLYQSGQDLSETDVSMFQPPMLEDMNFSMDSSQIEFQELRIRLCFLRVMVGFLGNYRKFMLLQAEESENYFDLDRLFDRKSFSKSFHEKGDESLYLFASQLSETQIFSDFILNRVTHSEKFQELFFFDYCIALHRDDGVPAMQSPLSMANLGGSTGNLNIPVANPLNVNVNAAPLPSPGTVATPTHVFHGTIHHSKSSSEVSKDVVKLEKLRKDLKKKIHSVSLLQVTYIAVQELIRSGSLTVQTLEQIRNLPPSLLPMPLDWMKLHYDVPPPDAAGGIPEGKGPYSYDTFPNLDPLKFGEYAESNEHDLEPEVGKNLSMPSSPNRALKWLMRPDPFHTLVPSSIHQSSSLSPSHDGASTTSHTPKKLKGGATPAPPVRRGTELEAYEAGLAANEHARGKIIVSLYSHINSLQDRMRNWGGLDKTVLPHAQVLYELWFALYTASCETERVRKRALRRRRIKEGSYFPTTFLTPHTGGGAASGSGGSQSGETPVSSNSSDDANSQLGHRRGGSVSLFGSVPGSPIVTSEDQAAALEASLRAEEHRECLTDLLNLFVELHAMVSRAGVLPSERMLEDLSLFVLRMNLAREFQEIFRLFSTSVPHLSTRFFAQLVRIGISNPITHPTDQLGDWGDAATANSIISPATNSGLVQGSGANPLMSAHNGAFLSTFEGSPAAAATNPEETPSYSYPNSIRTHCVCTRCQYELSGEEILAGWMLHAERIATSCPLCDTSVTPSLIVSFGGLVTGSGETEVKEVKVDYMKPSALRGTLHSLAILRRSDMTASTARLDVSRNEFLLAARSNPELFWNLFFFFTARGPRSRGKGLGTLPSLFLFSEESELLGRVAVNYVADVGPHAPWTVKTEREVSLNSNSATSPYQSPIDRFASSNRSSMDFSGDRDRTLSWDAESVSSEATTKKEVSFVRPHAASNAVASDAHHHLDKDSMKRASTQPDPDPSSRQSAATLLNGLLDGSEEDNRTLKVTFGDDTDDRSAPSSRKNSGAGFKLESAVPSPAPSPAPVVSAVDKALLAQESSQQSVESPEGGTNHQPSVAAGLETAHAQARRGSLSVQNVQYIMNHVKSRPLHQAVRTILRARRARKGWTAEEKKQDENFFAASMHQSLAFMAAQSNIVNGVPTPPDPVSFLSEYKSALVSLDASIEAHRKAIEGLEAASSLLQTGGVGAHPPLTPSSASASSGVLSQAASTAPTLDSEAAQTLEAKKRKKELTALALEDSIAMKAELLPCDAPPLQPHVNMLQSVRKFFGCELHRTLTKPSSSTVVSFAAGTRGGEKDAHDSTEILDDILGADIPSLEDVLTQVSQNPLYTLNSFTRFATAYKTKEEKRLALKAATEAPAKPVAETTETTEDKPAALPTSTAFNYLQFWSAVRRWRVRYERNDRNRSLSIIVKSPHSLNAGASGYDGVFESARSIYERFLITKDEQEAAAGGDSVIPLPATTPSALAHLTLPGGPSDVTGSGPRSRRSSDVGGGHERRSSTTLDTITESQKGEETGNEVTPTASGAVTSASSPPVSRPSISVIPPTPSSSAAFPLQSPFPTPHVGGHITTVRGLVLPRPLHESIRRILKEKVPVEVVDPLLGTKVLQSLTHHSVPKYLFDDVANVVLTWLKKHVYPAYLEEIRQEEEAERAEAARLAEEERVKKAKADEEARAAAYAAAHPPPPPIPPRPTRNDAAAGGKDATVAAGAAPPPVDRSNKPHGLPQLQQQQQSGSRRNSVTSSAPSTTVAPISTTASTEPDTGSNHNSVEPHSPSHTTSSTSPLSPSNAAPLPLLHNVSNESMNLAKSGGHVPDFSSHASPTESHDTELP